MSIGSEPGGRGILAIGECMVEMAPREDGAYSRNFAGDTFNTAWYLRRLLPSDVAVDYCTAVGEDGISSEMLAFMKAAGVGTDSIRRIGNRTVGLYMIQLSNGERSFVYWRENSAARCLAEDRAWLEVAVSGRSLVIFSGITLAILSPDHRRVLLEVLAEARNSGTQIAFDPNMRARLWPDRESMCAAIMQAAEVADIVLPSFDEDQAAFGDASPQDTIGRYRSKGVMTVVVKNGAGPVLAEDCAEGRVEFRPPVARSVVDTTAAGDSFNAGFLSAWMTGGSLSGAIEQGALLAGRVIRKRGALVDTDG